MEVPTASAIKEDDYKSETTQSRTSHRQEANSCYLQAWQETAALLSLPATNKVLQAIVPIKKHPQRQSAQRLLITRRTAVPHLPVHKTCTLCQWDYKTQVRRGKGSRVFWEKKLKTLRNKYAHKMK